LKRIKNHYIHVY